MPVRPRILHVIARLNAGGPALQAILLERGLRSRGYDTTLVAGTESRGEVSLLDLRGIDDVVPLRLPSLGRDIRGGADLVAFLGLVRIMRAMRPDLVHTHTAKAGTLGRLAARLARVPRIVHSYHGHVLRGYFSPVVSRAFLAVEKALARTSDRLVAVSQAVAEELVALGVAPPDRFAVIPVGLDLDPFLDSGRHSGEFRRELGLAASTPTVAIVARLVPIKAHEVFLEMARQVALLHPAVVFLVAGDGPCRNRLERRADVTGLSERVRFLGWRGDLARVYADSDVVVLTSRNEGAPLALIEALASARPVVSTRVGGVADVVDDGVSGWLVGVDDADALARAVARLLSDDAERRRFGNAGRRRARAAFGAERLVTDTDRLYQEVLSTRDSRSARGFP